MSRPRIWIDVIPDAEATGHLHELYDRIRGLDGSVDNIMLAHGLRPAEMDEALVAAMRAQGMSDGEVLEINQVVAYFAYANRTVLGLGVTTNGDTLGLSPSASEDPTDWSHR